MIHRRDARGRRGRKRENTDEEFTQRREDAKDEEKGLRKETEWGMAHRFVPPTFKNGELELRFDAGEVAIYGTPRGLTRLANICLRLAIEQKGSSCEHVHLEDRELLADDSLRGTVAVFPQES